MLKGITLKVRALLELQKNYLVRFFLSPGNILKTISFLQVTLLVNCQAFWRWLMPNLAKMFKACVIVFWTDEKCPIEFLSQGQLDQKSSCTAATSDGWDKMVPATCRVTDGRVCLEDERFQFAAAYAKENQLHLTLVFCRLRLSSLLQFNKQRY